MTTNRLSAGASPMCGAGSGSDIAVRDPTISSHTWRSAELFDHELTQQSALWQQWPVVTVGFGGRHHTEEDIGPPALALVADPLACGLARQ
jgi:hypothetical protein